MKPGLSAVLLLALGALQAPAALAHAVVKQSMPADGAELALAPKEVTITFTERLEKLFSTVSLRDAAGGAIATPKATLDPANPSVLRMTVPPLKSGRYVVKWTAVGHDGHRQGGEIRFSVR